MPAQHLINVDLATIKVPATNGQKAETRILAWGDEVEVVAITASRGRGKGYHLSSTGRRKR